MDRTPRPAVRLPPATRLVCLLACVLLVVLEGFPASAAVRSLPPPPQRVAAVWGRPGWSPASPGPMLAPPLSRLGAQWAERVPLTLPIASRSLYG